MVLTICFLSIFAGICLGGLVILNEGAGHDQ